MSGLINKIKNTLHHDEATPNTTSGPHSTDAANKADPRVDSDNSKMTGTHHHHDHHHGHNTTAGGAGPHSSTMENKLDPRVDSDGSKGYGAGATTGTTGTTGTGYGTSTTGTTGTGYGTTGGAGPHSSSIENKLDPRVDSDGSKGYGAGTTTGTGTGTGMGHGTSHTAGGAGPHSSGLMNKLDPRVDSDGSKGIPGGSNTNTGYTGPPDAAKMPPSEFQKLAGHPTDSQGNVSDHATRHGSVAHLGNTGSGAER